MDDPHKDEALAAPPPANYDVEKSRGEAILDLFDLVRAARLDFEHEESMYDCEVLLRRRFGAWIDATAEIDASGLSELLAQIAGICLRIGCLRGEAMYRDRLDDDE